jgi:hypothetical protein
MAPLVAEETRVLAGQPPNLLVQQSVQHSLLAAVRQVAAEVVELAEFAVVSVVPIDPELELVVVAVEELQLQ